MELVLVGLAVIGVLIGFGFIAHAIIRLLRSRRPM